jgi:hypothetical protein
MQNNMCFMEVNCNPIAILVEDLLRSCDQQQQLFMACQVFTRPYCGKQLSWWVLQDECDPDKAPDIVFQEDPSFSPLTSSSSGGQFGDDSLQQQLLHLLRTWCSSSSLTSVIGLLLALYAQHNKERIAAAVTDERILFELSMLDELGCSEVLLTGEPTDGTGTEQYSFGCILVWTTD